MELRTVWQYGSNNPENSNRFATISQWWHNLNGKEILWQQRLITPTAEASNLNWEPQRFDEKFLVVNPALRGITLYWQKPDSPQERSTTAHKLELDHLHQQLYIFPQSQKEVVIRVELPQVAYQTVVMQNPQWQVAPKGSDYLLTLRDDRQQVIVQATFDAAQISQFKQQLP